MNGPLTRWAERCPCTRYPLLLLALLCLVGLCGAIAPPLELLP